MKKTDTPCPVPDEKKERIRALAAKNHDDLTFAKNFVELAEILGVSRQSLYAWRKKPGAPVPAANGKHRIVEWREFIRSEGLAAGGGETATPDGEALRARKLLAEIEERELKVAIRKGEYILAETVRTQIAALASGAVAILRAKFENELPPLIAGKSAVEIREISARVIDEVSEAVSRFSPEKKPATRTRKKKARPRAKRVKH